MAKTLITAKISPDLDGVACMYAYAEFLKNEGKDVIAGVFGEPHVEAKYLLDKLSITDLAFNPIGSFENYILVDMSELTGLPEFIKPRDIIEVIDHRSFGKGTETFPNAVIRNEPVGAAATLITEKFSVSTQKISSHSAILLAGAIYSNTLNFKGGVTTDRDHKAMEWLQKQTTVPENLVHDMFSAKTQAVATNLEEVLRSDFKDGMEIRGEKIGIAQLEIVDSEKIIGNKLEFVLNLLRKLNNEKNLDHTFLSVPDLEKGFNLIVTDETEYQKVLSSVFNITFNNSIAKTDKLLMRKEIIPVLRN